MSRLTETVRDKIARAAVRHKFSPLEEAMRIEEDALAMRCYRAVYPAEQLAIVATLPKEWLRHCSCLRFNAGGWSVSLNTAQEVPTHHATYCTSLGDISGGLAEEVQAYSQRKEKRKTDCHAAEAELQGFLSSFKTFKQLRDNWPEGEQFYKQYDVTRNAPSVPALRTAKINEMLGLTTEVAA